MSGCCRNIGSSATCTMPRVAGLSSLVGLRICLTSREISTRVHCFWESSCRVEPRMTRASLLPFARPGKAVCRIGRGGLRVGYPCCYSRGMTSCVESRSGEGTAGLLGCRV